MGNLSNYYAKEGKQNPYTSTVGSTGGQSSGGGLLQQYQKKNNLASPFSVVQNNTKPVQVTQPKSSPSFISSAPQIVSGIAKGINIGNLIITAATRQPTQPQINVSKVKLPTAQLQTPQKTISITPNQKVLTPSQLKIVAPQPLSGQSATMKPAKAGAQTITERYVGLVSKTIPEAVKAGDQTASDISRFVKSPTTFQSSASYDANNTDGLVKSLITKKVTDFLHLPHEVPGIIEAVAKAVAGPIGQGLSLAMQEKLNPPKTVSEAVGLKARQLTNAGTIALTPINAFFAAADKTPVVSEIMRASIIPFVAVGEIAHKSIGKLVDALPISDKEKNDIKGPLSELAALAAQVIVGHTLGKVTGEGMGKLNEVGKEAFTKMTKDIVETSGGKTTVSFSPQDVRKVAIFNEGGKYHKELVDILADKGKAAGDLWTKAVKEGITIELPFEKVVGMIDKPWWGKIKKFLNMEPTKATTTTQVPGKIAEPGTASTPVEKQILGLLPEKVNHNPQAVINAVIKGGLDTTPEGKGLIKAALEAQQAGTDLIISTKPTVGTVTGSTTPNSEKLIEKASADLTSQGIEADPKSIATEVLRQYQNLPPSNTIKNITPESIKSIVGTGVNELTFSPENTITLWRDNNPKVGQVNSFSLEKKFETQKPYVVNKADIAVNMSGEEIVKLFDEVYKNNAQAQEIYRENLKDWKQNEAEVLVIPKEDYKIAEPTIKQVVAEVPTGFSKPSVEDMAKRLELQQAANAEMAAIPTNTEAQTPVGTGELKKSKAYTRVFDMLKEEFRQDVNYSVLNLEKDAANAVEFIAKDPKAALRVGLGFEQPPVGQTETAVSIALAEKAATDGDFALQSRLESARSLRQTRRGQEIVSERGRFESDSPHKYMRELLNKRLSNLGANLKDSLSEAMNRVTSTKQAAMEKIDAEATKIKNAIRRDRKKIQLAQDIINSLICK